MNNQDKSKDNIETNQVQVSRRNFIKVAAVTSVGITFSFPLTSCSSRASNLNSHNQTTFSNAWVHIPEKGDISFTCPKLKWGKESQQVSLHFYVRHRLPRSKINCLKCSR